jgi:hypothetical protein
MKLLASPRDAFQVFVVEERFEEDVENRFVREVDQGRHDG